MDTEDPVPTDTETGIVFPRSGTGRSTSALGRAIVADALRGVDPVGARAAEGETSWRRAYGSHFRRLVEAGLLSRAAAVGIAGNGLACLYEQMRYSTMDGELPLAAAVTMPVAAPLQTVTITGSGEVEPELVLPYHGDRLRGSDLHRRLDSWVAAGVIEPSCAEAVRLVAANPEWLSLPGRQVVVLGAGAEMSPLTALLRWGAEVVAVDLPRQSVWQRLVGTAQRYAGRLHVPAEPAGHDLHAGSGMGVDLLHDSHRVAAWLGEQNGPLVVGNYVYADGARHVQVTAAVDVLTRHLSERRPDITLAFLATPTDVFAVPPEAVAEASRRWDAHEGVGRIRRPLRMVSGGRLLARNYPPGAEPRHQRQPGTAAGTQLRAGETAAAVAGHPDPGRRAAGVAARGSRNPYSKRGEEPIARGRVRRGAPFRHRSVRARHQQHVDGRAARARPVRRPSGDHAPVAGRGVRRRPWWPVASAVLATQRARHRRPPRRRRCPLTPR